MKKEKLIITGTDKLKIFLGKEQPQEININFIDEVNIIPCNPYHNKDFIKYELVKLKHGYEIVLEWSVVGIREVEIVIYY